jgi:hypothetical protein
MNSGRNILLLSEVGKLKPKSYKKRSAGSFIRTFIIAVILGLVFALIGVGVGAFVVKGINGVAAALIGLISGYPVGVIVAIALTRRAGNYGSILFGAAGSILGAIIIIILEEPLNLDLDPIVLFGAFFIIIPLLCLIGFYLKKLPEETSVEAN